MARTFAHSFARTHFLKAELTGLAAGTVNNSTFIKAIEYGVDNACLKDIEINLHDGKREKAVVKISVDWNKHEAFLQEVSSDLAGISAKKDGIVSGAVFKQIISLLNEFQNAKGLKYWWNIVWMADGEKLDTACGFGRVGKGSPNWIQPISQQAEGKSLFHELLEEIDVSFKIDES